MSAISRRETAENPRMEAAFPDHGEPVGFVSGPPLAPEFWAERTAAAFLSTHLR